MHYNNREFLLRNRDFHRVAALAVADGNLHRAAFACFHHRQRFAANPRMAMPLKNLDRLSDTELNAIRHQAANLRADLDGV